MNPQKRRLRSIWYSIKGRCQDKKHKDFFRYGGRGIKVCKEWCEDFDSFYKWSLKNGYQDGLEIDRRNNDGDYEPSNCRWANQYQQAWNGGKHKNGFTSKYKGVFRLFGDNKFIARIGYMNKKIHLGRFVNEDEAARAYDAAAIRLYGEFASLNFPTD